MNTKTGAKIRYDTTIPIGKDEAMSFLWKDEDGVAKDLSGYTSARMHIRLKIGSAATYLTRTTAGGGITLADGDETTDPLTPNIVVTFRDTDTENLTPAETVYDLELTDASGNKVHFAEGSITFARTVTRG